MENKIYKCDVCRIDRYTTDGQVYSTEPFDSNEFVTLSKAKAWCKSKMKDKQFYSAWIELYVSDEDDMIKQYSFYKGDTKWSETSNN